MTVVKLRPIVKTIDLGRSTRDAFRLFTEEISAWWPLKTHTLAVAAKGQKSVRVTIEPRVGGRVYETLQDGSQLEWGEVLAYNPGRLFSMEWLLGRPSSEATEVTVRFEKRDDAGCRVTLTHENWENIGGEGERLRNSYDNGWIAVFEKGFGEFAGRA
jgi:uncharacterized protein YndB with AHSA1/START domain